MVLQHPQKLKLENLTPQRKPSLGAPTGREEETEIRGLLEALPATEKRIIF